MSKKILSFAPFGQYLVHNQVDAVLTSALRLRGADVAIVGCDGLYNKCDILVRSGENSADTCIRCSLAGKDFFNAFQLPVLQLRQYINSTDYNAANHWAHEFTPQQYPKALLADFPIGEYVKSSVHSYFRITDRDLLREDVIPIYRQYLVNGALTLFALSRIFDEQKPDKTIVFNARFAPYRIAYELSRARGLDVVMHERGFADDTFIFYSNAKCTEVLPQIECDRIWENVPLSTAQLNRVQEYLDNREKGKDLNTPGFYDFTNDAHSIRHALRIPEGARIMGVFTSTESELASSDEFTAVSIQIEMIGKLIEIFRNRPDDYLVIRHHPNLGGAGEVAPEFAFMGKAIEQLRDLPANVRIIMPKEKLNTYALLWNVDACFALFSTVGTEAPSRGVPTAALKGVPSAKAHPLVVSDITVEVLTEVTNGLFNRVVTFNSEDMRKLYRFITVLISRTSVKLKSCGMRDHFGSDIRIKDLTELAPGKDLELDRIVDHLLTGSPIFPVPSVTDLQRTSEEEDKFFNERLTFVKRTREKLRELSIKFSAEQSSKIKNSSVGIIEMSSDSSDNSSFPNWLNSSRHRAHHFERLFVAPAESIVEKLLSKLNASPNELTLVTLNGFRYDSSFLSSAVDFLVGDLTHEHGVVLNGAWFLDKDGAPFDEILTKRRTAQNFAELSKANAVFKNPAAVLGLCVFRTQWLIALLGECKTLTSAESLAAFIFEQLPTLKVMVTEIPSVLIDPVVS